MFPIAASRIRLCRRIRRACAVCDLRWRSPTHSIEREEPSVLFANQSSAVKLLGRIVRG